MRQLSAVIGLGFGDEGKGTVTDWLCSQDPASTLVVRFSGGHQAAHTVRLGDVEHVFSNFGSGTLRGCPTYWTRFCTFEPVGFCRELDVLKGKGITPKIFISSKCLITTPYDIMASHVCPERKHGTTGTGFWKTIERNLEKCYFILDFNFAAFISYSEEYAKSILKNICSYYQLPEIDLNEFWSARAKIHELMLNGNVFLIREEFDKKHPTAPNIIFEGSQGLLLDKDIGFFPHVTPSNTDLTNIMEMDQYRDELTDIYLVTRAYQTRHGIGPMTNENLVLNLREAEESSTKENEFQGKLRNSVLDLDLLRYGLNKARLSIKGTTSRNYHLVVTCLDRVEGLKIFTNGGKIQTFYDTERFVRAIAEYLGLKEKINFCGRGKLYGNWSPIAGSIREI